MRRKTKVTPKGNTDSVTNGRIIKYLLSISPRPETPGDIAAQLGIDKKQCKVYCSRLFTRGRIGRDERGLYRALYSLDDLLKSESPEMKLHALKLEGCYQMGASLGNLLLLQTKIQPSSGGREMAKLGFEGRRVTIQYSPTTGTVEIYLRTTKYPISFIDFEKFNTWLETILTDKTLYFGLKVVQLEVGRDFRKWRLEGLKAIKLGAWRNAWAQIYQKSEDIMRLEIRVNTTLKTQDAINILRGMVEPPKPQYEIQPDKRQDVA